MNDGVTSGIDYQENFGTYQKPGPETALVSPSSYYRSKVLTVNQGINPLVSAASSIFSILAQCQSLREQSDLNTLQQEFIHEILSFESVAQSLNQYQEKTLLASRFALCALIDEHIQQALGDHRDLWQPFLLLKRFHGTEWGGQQFYILLDRAMCDASGYIDMLELYYLCLSLGYQGKFQNNDQGYLIRENIINKLYQSIREQRGEFTRSVVVGSEHKQTTTTPKRKMSKGALLISIFAIFTMGSVVLSEYFTVQSSNDAVHQAMTNLLHTQLDTLNDYSRSQTR